MLRRLLLILLLLAGAAPAHGQRVSPYQMSIPEQLRMNFYDIEGLTAALPGLAEVKPGHACEVTVYLVDTAAWADSARAIFRHARPGCEGPPEVRVRPSRYTLAEMRALEMRVAQVLAEPGLRVRGGGDVHPDGSITVEVQNRAALERARQRLLRESGIPHADLVFVPPAGVEELDSAAPPRAAYLAVLDSVAAHVRTHGGYGRLVAGSLPAGLNVDDVRARGLPLLKPSDRCGTVGRVTFGEPRQFTDGTYLLRTLEGVRPGIPDDVYYYLRCDASGICHVFRMLKSGDLIVTGCPAEAES